MYFTDCALCKSTNNNKNVLDMISALNTMIMYSALIDASSAIAINPQLNQKQHLREYQKAFAI